MSSFLLLTEGEKEGEGVTNQALVYWGPLLEEICWSNMFESLAAEVSSRAEGRGEEKTGESCAKVVVTQLRPSISARRVQLTEATTVVTHFYHSVSSGGG